jgi:hypothetical protein
MKKIEKKRRFISGGAGCSIKYSLTQDAGRPGFQNRHSGLSFATAAATTHLLIFLFFFFLPQPTSFGRFSLLVEVDWLIDRTEEEFTPTHTDRAAARCSLHPSSPRGAGRQGFPVRGGRWHSPLGQDGEGWRPAWRPRRYSIRSAPNSRLSLEGIRLG